MNLLFLLKPKNSVDFIYADDSMRKGLAKLRTSGYTAAPVVTREGKYMGTVTEGDFLWYLHDTTEPLEEIVNEVYVEQITRENWNQPVHISATMDELLELVLNQNFVPVVDDRNLFVGIITRQSVIRHFVDRIKKLKHQVEEQNLDEKEGENK
ncbi:MAG TPA: CBS domain-containing protein [Lachnospiraceae bacterium]|nr:CBS domain-containing protein [Lachnospiraceae bacterium]